MAHQGDAPRSRHRWAEISEYEVSVTAIVEASSEEEAKKYFRRWLAAGSSRDPQVIAGWAARPRPTPPR